jgi:hypothetical protein
MSWPQLIGQTLARTYYVKYAAPMICGSEAVRWVARHNSVKEQENCCGRPILCLLAPTALCLSQPVKKRIPVPCKLIRSKPAVGNAAVLKCTPDYSTCCTGIRGPCPSSSSAKSASSSTPPSDACRTVKGVGPGRLRSASDAACEKEGSTNGVRTIFEHREKCMCVCS